MPRSLLALSLCLVACSSSSSSSDLAFAPFDFSQQPDLSTAPTSVYVSGKVIDIEVGPTAPAAGVQVCRHPEGSPCTTTDAAGLYALEGMPYDADFALKFSGGGFLSELFAFHLTDNKPGFNLALPKASGLSMMASTAGKTLDASKTTFLLNVFPKEGASVDGATVTLVPAQGEGPYYFTGLAPSFTLTSSVKVPGVVVFFNVPVAASLEVVVTPPSGTCTGDTAWSASGGHFKAPMASDTLTGMGIFCG